MLRKQLSSSEANNKIKGRLDSQATLLWHYRLTWLTGIRPWRLQFMENQRLASRMEAQFFQKRVDRLYFLDQAVGRISQMMIGQTMFHLRWRDQTTTVWILRLTEASISHIQCSKTQGPPTMELGVNLIYITCQPPLRAVLVMER